MKHRFSWFENRIGKTICGTNKEKKYLSYWINDEKQAILLYNIQNDCGHKFSDIKNKKK